MPRRAGGSNATSNLLEVWPCERAQIDLYRYVNGLGSVVAVTDSNGNTVNQYSYDPYGNATSVSEQVPNPFRYAGAVWDSQTGLYQMGERYYDPSIGRFSQPDPSGGGYAYVDGNPMNFVDPLGLGKHTPQKPKSKPGRPKVESHVPGRTYRQKAGNAKRIAGIARSQRPIKQGYKSGYERVKGKWTQRITRGRFTSQEARTW